MNEQMQHWPQTDTLAFDCQNGWLTIRLNRPAQRNAMSRQMTAELTDALTRASADRSLRGIILRGNGGVFCAGGDLAEFKADFQSSTPDRADIEAASRAAGQLFYTLNTMPQLTIALVEGAAMAGGLGLMCACDISVAVKGAKFGLTETTLGIPPAQIAPYVRSRTGLSVARKLMLTATRFDAVEGQRLGLITTVVEDAMILEAEAQALQTQLHRCAPEAVSVTKAILLDDTGSKAQIDRAAEAFANCILSDEGREGIAAFFEKRRPPWAVEAPQ